MPWNDLANNQTISFTNLKDGVDTGVLSQKAAIPTSNEQITKADANTYINTDTSFFSYAAKASNQLLVKSDLQSVFSVVNTPSLLWRGIANNQTTSGPIQLIAGLNLSNNLGLIYKSTDYGENYSSVFNSGSSLRSIKFMTAFRHASYLSVIPFLVVGLSGRIITNSNNDSTSWIAISSPTVRDLYDIAFNDVGVGIIVGENRIIKTDTNYRINSWSIVASGAQIWRAVASDGFRFVAVGDNSVIITGTSSGTIWTTQSMPPLVPSKQLLGVTFHTDGFWYVVGRDTANGSLPFIMKSTDSFGFNWEIYNPAQGNLLLGGLFSIASIGGRLIIGGYDAQYQIINNTVTRYYTRNIGITSIDWLAIVKNANSNGFDMAGISPDGGSTVGGYSNF